MKQNQPHSGFSLVFAIGVTLLFSLLAIFIMEYMIPFSRSVSGIEQASQSYYNLESAIEEVAYQSYSGGIGYTVPSKAFSGSDDFSFVAYSSGLLIPKSGYGNSPKSPANVGNWNILSQTSPISLSIGNGILSGKNLKLSIRVPDFDGNGISDSLDDANNLVMWQLNSDSDSLTLIDNQLIDIPISLKNLFSNGNAAADINTGENLTGTQIKFLDFYNSNCGVGKDCILKISLIHPLISGGKSLPYLEYQIQSNYSLPYQETYADISSQTQNYARDITIALPHKSTSSAFDFTVLQ